MLNDVPTLDLLGFCEKTSSFARSEEIEGPRGREAVPEGAARSAEAD